MFDPSWLWAVFTVVAAAAQTVRNATQRELTARLGTVGATHVRFLFGFPFALVFLAGVMLALGQELPRPPPIYWPWVIAGALTQIAATALMLAAMNDRSFVVVYAYIKTEPVQAALFGLVFLGDVVTPAMAAAILIATAGVVIMALKPGTSSDLKATLLGLAAGAMFAASAVGYRGAILGLALPSYVMAATFTLAVGLVLQSALLSLYLWLRNPDVLAAIVRAWRPSLFAGFMGALASQFWFLAFALAHGCQRAHARFGRSAVRASDLALRVQAGDHAARSLGHRSDRHRRRAVAVGAVIARLRWSAAERQNRFVLFSVCAAEWSATPGNEPRLIALVRQHRQRVKLDPLLVQLPGLLGRGLAVDRAVLDLAVVHLARLLGKFRADIVGALGEVLAQLLQLLAELAFLRR
jgi:drug/metabolite transporter (DMT)-like permease